MAAVAPSVVEPPASAAVARPLAREAQLVAAVRGGAPLRRALARVAGRMSACRGWERLGFARPGDYAVERAGVSAREMRDLVRVDRALAELAVLEAAFLAGAIGWTQLRLLCRVARPEDQHAWLDLAKRLGARALAREVRAVDRRALEPLPECEDGAREGVVLRVSRGARARWWAARKAASRVAGHALSHTAFAEVLAAEVLSGVAMDGEGGREARSAETETARARTREVARRPGRVRRGPPADAPPVSAEVAALECDLETADAFELDRRLRAAVRLEARALARVASGLAEVAVSKLYREVGFHGLDAYAEERLGMSASRARALLRIHRVARRCAALRSAFATGRLSWVQAHAIVPLLVEPGAARYRGRWVEHAARVTVRRLGEDVERALASGELEPPSLARGIPSGLQTGAIARSPTEDARLFFSAAAEVARLFRAVLATVQRRIERIRGRPACTSEALEAMLEHALTAWEPETPTARQRREQAVFERDGWRCTVPGCTSYRNLQKHHVVFRSRGGSDDASNLTTLCAWHHLRGIHGGVLRCTGTAPDGLRFELGVRAGRAPLAVYASGDLCVAA